MLFSPTITYTYNMYSCSRVLNGMIIGAISIGMATKYMPDYSKGKKAADYLYTLFEHNATINGQTDSGDTMVRIIQVVYQLQSILMC